MASTPLRHGPVNKISLTLMITKINLLLDTNPSTQEEPNKMSMGTKDTRNISLLRLLRQASQELPQLHSLTLHRNCQ